MEERIKIPHKTNEEFSGSLIELMSAIEQIQNFNAQVLLLDFSDAGMLYPFYLGGMASIVRKKQIEGSEVAIKWGKNKKSKKIESYLKTIRFPGTYGTEENDKLSIEELREYGTKTYLPFINFKTGRSEEDTKYREGLLSTISNILGNKLKFSAKEQTPLMYFLTELTHNIIDHSGATEGYVFAQYYKGKKYIDLCIIDHGKGIFQSFEGNLNFSPESHAEAIQYAVQGKSTKEQDEKRGYGLSTSIKMLVNGLKGKIWLWSGSAVYINTLNNAAILDNKELTNYDGTFVGLRIPTSIPGNFNFYNFVE